MRILLKSSPAAAALVLLSAILLLGSSSLSAQNGGGSTLDRLKQHIETLASPDLTGRRTGTDGARKAAAYLDAELRELGLVPMSGDTDFYDPFDFTAGTKDGGSSIETSIDGKKQSWSSRDHVSALSFSDSGTVSGEVVFVGYGLVVPGDQDFDYDSYALLDVTDKIVVALRYVPEEVDGEARATLGRYSGLRFKALSARQRGAKALVVVTGPNSPNAGEVIPHDLRYRHRRIWHRRCQHLGRGRGRSLPEGWQEPGRSTKGLRHRQPPRGRLCARGCRALAGRQGRARARQRPERHRRSR